ncbi:rhamnulokinase [Tardisphaera miroshnichenkoae]
MASPEEGSSLAIDLGASGGKCLVGTLEDRTLSVRQIRSFPNFPVKMAGHLYWDVPRLWEEIKATMRAAGPVSSVGIDSWGVDFALLRDGEMVGVPRAYRDPCFKGVMKEVFAVIPKQEIYRKTGIQFLDFNTIYQLYWASTRAPHELGSSLLMIPDLFHFLLTGVSAGELSNASTTQLLDLEGRWWEEALTLLKVNVGLPSPLQASAPLGELSREVVEEVGYSALVVLPAIHDTASAIAAAPYVSEDVAYVSSGTWDIIGMELSSPRTGEDAMLNNFSNERGAFSKFNFLRNAQGMWMLQGLKRSFEAADGREYSYDDITKLAASSEDVGSYVDVDDPIFALPDDMASAVVSYLDRTEQKKPMGKGELARLVIRSLAMKRRYVLELAQKISGRRIRAVNVFGGGSRNSLLNQMTADVLGLPVYAGPDEATAVGNLLVQQVGLGNLPASEARDVVKGSFDVKAVEPARMDDGYPDFLRAIGATKGLV